MQQQLSCGVVLSQATNAAVCPVNNRISHSCCLLLPIPENPQRQHPRWETSANLFWDTTPTFSAQCPHSLRHNGLPFSSFTSLYLWDKFYNRKPFPSAVQIMFQLSVGCDVLLMLYVILCKINSSFSLTDCIDFRNEFCLSLFQEVYSLL